MVHRRKLLVEIETILASVDAHDLRTKVSKERRMKGRVLYSPIDMNRAIGTRFAEHGWSESRTSYWVTRDASLIRQTMTMPPEEQKEAIVRAGQEPIYSYNQTDYVQRNKIVASVDTLLQNHSHPRYLFEDGAVFSLLYPQKGDITTMRGICPTGNNLEWLKLFKAAVGQCTARSDTGADPQDTSRERPQIEVSGLASVGPGHADEDVDPDSAALLNLRIANMRTVSVAAVLLADSTPSTLVVDSVCQRSRFSLD